MLSYLISRLQAQSSHKDADGNGSSAPTLSVKQLLLPIKALCTAASQLQRTEQFALAAVMKNAKLPQHIKTCLDIETMKDGTNIPITEGKPVRFDLSNTILKQLSKPLHCLSLDVKSPNCESNSVDCISVDISKQNEVRKNFADIVFTF